MPDILGELPNLEELLWRLVEQIPAGRVTTCGQLGQALGDRLAARWIGHVMLHHGHTPQCGCHRVVRAGGELGGYVGGDRAAKRRRLTSEGVDLQNERLDLARFGFADFRTDQPLVALRRFQETLGTRYSRIPPQGLPTRIGAVDVSYAKTGEAVAAYGLFASSAPHEPTWSTTLRRAAGFPYITSYLAFRELPIVLELIQTARRADRLAGVVLVDGSGILHPRRAGIATMLGILSDTPTIGVTKKLLCGNVDTRDMLPGESRSITFDGHEQGFAVGAPSGSKQPLFVSPGHRSDVPFCRRVIDQLLQSETANEHRLLEPIHFVDRLSRATAKD